MQAPLCRLRTLQLQWLNCIYHSCREVLWDHTLSTDFVKTWGRSRFWNKLLVSKALPYISQASQNVTAGKKQAAKSKGGGTSLRSRTKTCDWEPFVGKGIWAEKKCLFFLRSTFILLNVGTWHMLGYLWLTLEQLPIGKQNYSYFAHDYSIIKLKSCTQCVCLPLPNHHL